MDAKAESDEFKLRTMSCRHVGTSQRGQQPLGVKRPPHWVNGMTHLAWDSLYQQLRPCRTGSSVLATCLSKSTGLCDIPILPRQASPDLNCFTCVASRVAFQLMVMPYKAVALSLARVPEVLC